MKYGYRYLIEAHSDASDEASEFRSVYMEGVERSLNDLTMELAFLMIQWRNDPSFSAASIARMITEEVGYCIRVGIVSPEIYPYVSEWSAWIASVDRLGIQPLNSSSKVN